MMKGKGMLSRLSQFAAGRCCRELDLLPAARPGAAASATGGHGRSV